MEDGSPILYLRYKNVSEILLVRRQPVGIMPLTTACRSRMHRQTQVTWHTAHVNRKAERAGSPQQQGQEPL